MNVKTLDGKDYKLHFDTKKQYKISEPHLKIRVLLKELYPTVLILEELQIEVKKNKYLYLDFFIPLYQLAIEIDGTQHIEFNTHFHKNLKGYAQSLINDNLKSLWCELNNITLIHLKDKETKEEWQQKLIKTN